MGGSAPELESMRGEDAVHQAPTSLTHIGTEVGEERREARFLVALSP